MASGGVSEAVKTVPSPAQIGESEGSIGLEVTSLEIRGQRQALYHTRESESSLTAYKHMLLLPIRAEIAEHLASA